MTVPYREAAYHEIVHAFVDVVCPWCKAVVRVEVAVDAECIACGARFSVGLAKRAGVPEVALDVPRKRSIAPKLIAAIALFGGLAFTRPLVFFGMFVAYGASLAAMAVWHFEHDRQTSEARRDQRAAL
jgi:hypothetical protein